MNRDDAEEYTQALGQVLGGGWRQIALAKRLDVPKTLGLTTAQWVNDRLGGYVRLSVDERREAVKQLTAEGDSQREIADVLGIGLGTVNGDLSNVQNRTPEVAKPKQNEVAEDPDVQDRTAVELPPIDALAALAAEEKVRAEHDRQTKLAADREAKRHDDWYTPRWLFDQLGVTFDLDVCAPIDPARRTVPARRYYTQDDDGLTQPWTGLVWCNPPYSAPQPWMQRFAEHDNGMLLSVVSAKTGRMAPHWRTADRIVMFAGMVFDRPDGSTEAPYLPLTLCARGPAAELLTDIEHKWAGPVLQRIA